MLFAGVTFGKMLAWSGSIPSYTIEIISFLAITNIAAYSLLVGRARAPGFTIAYLFSMVSKIVFYAAFVVIIIVLDRAGAVANAVLFMIGYLLFTVLEVSFLFRAVNR